MERMEREERRRKMQDGLLDNRATHWKILFGYLPLEVSEWKTVLEEKRKLYKCFLGQDFIPETHVLSTSHLSLSLTAEQITENNKSARNEAKMDPNASEEVLADIEVFDDIHLDVIRTLSYFTFYSDINDAVSGMSPKLVSLERILFLFAKMNAGLSYVQGMNEIVAILYYVFSNDASLDEVSNLFDIEADTFFVFHTLINEVRDWYIVSADSSSVGIHAVILQVETILLAVDPELYNFVKEIELKPQYYALKWYTTLLSREFDVQEVLPLWDFLFSDPTRFQNLALICVAMLIHVKYDIMRNDFGHSLQLLLEYQSLSVKSEDLIESAKQFKTFLNAEKESSRISNFISKIRSASLPVVNMFSSAVRTVSINLFQRDSQEGNNLPETEAPSSPSFFQKLQLSLHNPFSRRKSDPSVMSNKTNESSFLSFFNLESSEAEKSNRDNDSKDNADPFRIVSTLDNFFSFDSFKDELSNEFNFEKPAPEIIEGAIDEMEEKVA